VQVLATDAMRSSKIGDTHVKKPILVVASQVPKEVEDRIDRDYHPRRNLHAEPFSREQLLASADGADAIFITPWDRLDSIFFQRVSPAVKVIAPHSVVFEHIDLPRGAKEKYCHRIYTRHQQ
jgi:lactate dehydrogenase-like 2-hydroxyacid dehydrogenase